ncbi:L-fucose operon activator [Photorhabdus luminescens]|uniref:Transcriptional regulator n=1 Tax=Photorhabdus luminescens subsp. mexicana TaxID=2100167 RepID=A0A4R4JRI1_PHOLU|nr:L-fucose operon activator [Photorhabdus luminescens]TDB56049.1 transcriptional regulator [Photorhabdus luminescens subsp. mexicana]
MRNERHQKIMDLLHHHESLTTSELSVALQVSKETIRRDLRFLQEHGHLLRLHGKAKSLNRETQDNGDPFNIRVKSHFSSKSLIAQRAVTWISEGMIIALDASSTCWYLAKQLPDINITIFTNSIRICHQLSKKKNIQLISSGGVLHRKYACYVSSSLIAQLKNLEIDLFVFSCDGIDANGDLWDSNIDNAEFKDILIRRSLQSILLIDKSKINRKSEIKIGNRSNITDIISNYQV